jgi:hypothetical protein
LLTADSSSTTTTTTLYPWRQVEEEQAERYRTICRHFDNNARYAIQGKDQEAETAAIAGLELVSELYDDLLDPADRFLSDTAGDRLLDMVRFCFGYAFQVGDTTWPNKTNSVYELEGPWTAPGVRENWMAVRGWLLVTEMDKLGLFERNSAHLRAFMVRAVNFVAELCFGLWGRAVVANSEEHAEFWDALDNDALILIADQEDNADPVVRDAAKDADSDLVLRDKWVKCRKKQAELRRERLEAEFERQMRMMML